MNASPPSSVWRRPEPKALRSLVRFRAASVGSENTGINTGSHAHAGPAPNSLPVTHQWCRMEPSAAVRRTVVWDRVTGYSDPVVFGKQRAKVSWMSGVSRGDRRGSGLIGIMPDGLRLRCAFLLLPTLGPFWMSAFC